MPTTLTTRLYFCAALAVLLLNGRLEAASLLSNAGFESDTPGQSGSLPGWQTYGANTYSENNASIAHSGTNYFKVYQAFTGVLNYNGIYQDYISGPGAVYTANGWAYTATSDVLAGQNAAWIEVSFRDAYGNVLALYRSAQITTNTIATGAFPKGQWNNLVVTNQYDPGTFQIISSTAQLTAPSGTFYVRCQIVFEGDANNSSGSVYFDDLNLALGGGPPYGNMNIVWSDEFNGTSINNSVWTYDTGNGGWGNNELEKLYEPHRTMRTRQAAAICISWPKRNPTAGQVIPRHESSPRVCIPPSTDGWNGGHSCCAYTACNYGLAKRCGCWAPTSVRLAGRAAARST